MKTFKDEKKKLCGLVSKMRKFASTDLLHYKIAG
jgi:hypothetical protein